MAQAQQTQDTDTDTETKGKREAKPLTAMQALAKVNKILDGLSAGDRKRVLAFINESGD